MSLHSPASEVPATEKPSRARRTSLAKSAHPFSFVRLVGSFPFQLALCLVLALLVRIIILIRAHGMMEADEAVLGIQAERILRGELPIYFAGQNYMASWDAYLAAPLIALFGPSATLLHAITTAESLLLVPLLGALAKQLYGVQARLPAMLLAALPSLFVSATEIHMLGGYVETLVVGTVLLLVVSSIATHWEAGRSTSRLWLLTGLLTGFGIWIDPLIVSFLLAGILWIAPLALIQVRRGWSEGAVWWRTLALRTAVCCVGLLIGLTPTLVYAFQHQFVNYTFFVAGASLPGLRLNVLGYGISGALRHIIGYDNPWLPPIGRGHLLTLALGSVVLALTALAIGYAFFQLVPHAPIGMKRQNWKAGLTLSWWNRTLAPILLLVNLLLYWRTSAASLLKLSTTDRYLLPAAIAVSLILANWLVSVSLSLHRLADTRAQPQRTADNAGRDRLRSLALAGLLAFLLLASLVPYFTSYGESVLQSPYSDVSFPAHESTLLGYLEQQHIHYIWTNLWIGQVITYLEDDQITCADYVSQIYGYYAARFPEVIQQVAQADRASFIIRADPSQGKPVVEQALDALGVSYLSTHFDNYWVITPRSRTVQPQEILTALKTDY